MYLLLKLRSISAGYPVKDNLRRLSCYGQSPQSILLRSISAGYPVMVNLRRLSCYGQSPQAILEWSISAVYPVTVNLRRLSCYGQSPQAIMFGPFVFLLPKIKQLSCFLILWPWVYLMQRLVARTKLDLSCTCSIWAVKLHWLNIL